MVGCRRSGAADRWKAAGAGRPLVCCVERTGLAGARSKPEADEAGTKNAERVFLPPSLALAELFV